jgi:hypothetical protein
MNPATDEILEQLRTKVSPPKRRDITRKEEAEGKLYRDGDGAIGIPAQNLFASFVEAGRSVRLAARQNISTKESSMLPSFLSIEEIFLPFKGNPTWVPDARRGKNPNGGEMVCLIRPRFDSWEFDATIDFDEKEIAEETVRELIKKAGSRVGLCDFRPSRRGPFGRFTIASWVNLSPEMVSRSGMEMRRSEKPVGA